MIPHVRAAFRYDERVIKHIQPSTLQALGIIPGQFSEIKQWYAGEYYGSPGKDIGWLRKAIASK